MKTRLTQRLRDKLITQYRYVPLSILDNYADSITEVFLLEENGLLPHGTAEEHRDILIEKLKRANGRLIAKTN